ncbi:unnamed protein product [Ectocarpus sp. CCAP 1310/34]|nr:unnamed protein product [Ectocarpus sp. CCAP 1310/34]
MGTLGEKTSMGKGNGAARNIIFCKSSVGSIFSDVGTLSALEGRVDHS